MRTMSGGGIICTQDCVCVCVCILTTPIAYPHQCDDITSPPTSLRISISGFESPDTHTLVKHVVDAFVVNPFA